MATGAHFRSLRSTGLILGATAERAGEALARATQAPGERPARQAATQRERVLVRRLILARVLKHDVNEDGASVLATSIRSVVVGVRGQAEVGGLDGAADGERPEIEVEVGGGGHGAPAALEDHRRSAEVNDRPRGPAEDADEFAVDPVDPGFAGRARTGRLRRCARPADGGSESGKNEGASHRGGIGIAPALRSPKG